MWVITKIVDIFDVDIQIEDDSPSWIERNPKLYGAILVAWGLGAILMFVGIALWQYLLTFNSYKKGLHRTLCLYYSPPLSEEGRTLIILHYSKLLSKIISSAETALDRLLKQPAVSAVKL